MRKAGIKGAHRWKKHHLRWIPGEVYQGNILNSEFTVDEPNHAWCTDYEIDIHVSVETWNTPSLLYIKNPHN